MVTFDICFWIPVANSKKRPENQLQNSRSKVNFWAEAKPRLELSDRSDFFSGVTVRLPSITIKYVSHQCCRAFRSSVVWPWLRRLGKSQKWHENSKKVGCGQQLWDEANPGLELSDRSDFFSGVAVRSPSVTIKYVSHQCRSTLRSGRCLITARGQSQQWRKL